MANELASRPASSGVLLVDKPLGITSHTVVGRVRRVFGQREVGHTGTLDPLASGLMVLTLGRATRIARFIEATEKRYAGTVRLGRATTTFDAEGTTTKEAPIDGIDRAQVEAALASLTGKIAQSVPAFSAVKVGGTRLYSRARRGEEFETPVREVEVHSLELVSIDLPDVVIAARVSKGTYIRSLAVQIGEALGVPAHLAALRRTHVGDQDIARAKPLDALTGAPEELVAPADALAHLPAVRLDAAKTTDVSHGRALRPSPVLAGLYPGDVFLEGAPVRLLDPTGALIAVGIAQLASDQLASAGADQRVFGYACVIS